MANNLNRKVNERGRQARMDNNVATEGYEGVTLKCGHRPDGPAVTIYPGGRRTYRCAVGCGLQDGKRR